MTARPQPPTPIGRLHLRLLAALACVCLTGGIYAHPAEGQQGCKDLVKAEQHARACRDLAALGRCDEALARCRDAVASCPALPTFAAELERQTTRCESARGQKDYAAAGDPCGRKRACHPGLDCRRGTCAVPDDARERILEYHVNARALSPRSPCDARQLLELACTMAASGDFSDLFADIERDLNQERRACPSYAGYTCIETIAPASPDGMEVVFVPAGSFRRGSDRDGIQRGIQTCRKTYADSDKCDVNWFKRESPEREIHLDAYYIDKYEVSNAQWDLCVTAGACPSLDYGRCSLFQSGTGRWKLGGPPHDDVLRKNHPVVCVTWEEAQSYCEWAGKRLPSEAEWEKAARGGADARQFPWGDTWNGAWLNWGEVTGFGTQDGFETTSPVGHFPDNTSPYGAMDMAGNVWEWTLDFHSRAYYADSPEANPVNAVETANRVMRGGSWSFAGNGARVSYRYFGNPLVRDDAVGFRCAVAAE